MAGTSVPATALTLWRARRAVERRRLRTEQAEAASPEVPGTRRGQLSVRGHGSARTGALQGSQQRARAVGCGAAEAAPARARAKSTIAAEAAPTTAGRARMAAASGARVRAVRPGAQPSESRRIEVLVSRGSASFHGTHATEPVGPNRPAVSATEARLGLLRASRVLRAAPRVSVEAPLAADTAKAGEDASAPRERSRAQAASYTAALGNRERGRARAPSYRAVLRGRGRGREPASSYSEGPAPARVGSLRSAGAPPGLVAVRVRRDGSQEAPSSAGRTSGARETRAGSGQVVTRDELWRALDTAMGEQRRRLEYDQRVGIVR